jgi:cysteine desulfurase/selenocysteine lyase
MSYPIEHIRNDFAIFRQQPELAYLDSGASAQKPDIVIDGMADLQRYHYANIHRGAYRLSEELTKSYEEARHIIAKFLNSSKNEEIIFTYNTTSAINLLAYSMGRGKILKENDVILISEMEHHANIVPWQIIAEDIGAKIISIPIHDDGTLDMEAFEALLKEYPVKLAAMTHISNVLGTINPIKKICQLLRNHDVISVIDGSQAVMHYDVDVKALDCDFYCFTGHKIYGPTGIGVLYGKGDWFDRLPPFLGGGDMIKTVSFEGTIYNEAPAKFEAGTPPIIEAIGLSMAIIYYQDKLLPYQLHAYEDGLYHHALDILQQYDGMRILGTAKDHAPIISFVWQGYHPYDIASIFDMKQVCVRAGLHCAEPLMRRLNVNASVRLSLGAYNHMGDLQQLDQALQQCQKLLS